jgi:hypothetical protein
VFHQAKFPSASELIKFRRFADTPEKFDRHAFSDAVAVRGNKGTSRTGFLSTFRKLPRASDITRCHSLRRLPRLTVRINSRPGLGQFEYRKMSAS